MPMNSSDFPLVWMNLAQEPGQDHQKDFDAFEANLRRDEPFVILSDTAPPGHGKLAAADIEAAIHLH